MSSSTSTTSPRNSHLADLTRAELEKRYNDLMRGYNRLLTAIHDDYPDFDLHVQQNLPIRPMTKARSRLLAQKTAVKNEVLRIRAEMERRGIPTR